MPNAFRSLAKEKEAQKRVKAALGKEDREGWVHLEVGAVEEAVGAEGVLAEEVEAMEKRGENVLLEEGKLGVVGGERGSAE